MTWEADKKEVLDKFIDLYQGIQYSENRYEAGKVMFAEFDFFVNKILNNDKTLTVMLSIDNEFVNTYFETMSDLLGEEE